MSNNDSSSPHVMYGNTTTYHDSPLITGGQGSFLGSIFPLSQAYVLNDIDSVIEFLNVRRQRVNDVAEVAKELYHQRLSMMTKPNIQVEDSATLPIPNGGTFLSFTELEFGESDVDAFQYHISQGLGMDILHHADAPDATRPPVSMKVAGQHQAWAALSHNMQTVMTEIGDESLSCGEVARYHDKRTVTPAHATPPQSTNLDYGHTPGFGSARSGLSGQAIIPAALTYTSDNSHAGPTVSAPSRNGMGGPTVLSFMSGSIKHYRCDCGYESARKRDIDHHLESLQHSERKYGCSCGKKFTRYDSLKRHTHRKGSRNRCQMGLRA